MTDTNRISPAYLAEQKRLHADPRGYGTKGFKWAETIAAVADHFSPVASILDYGCGANTLAAALQKMGFRTSSYDPALPEFAAEPAPADLVTCCDVLEHVEPDCVPAVLEHLAALSGRALFVVVSLVTTDKRLSDGRSAHITIWTADAWIAAIEAAGFTLCDTVSIRPEKQFVGIFERAQK